MTRRNTMASKVTIKHRRAPLQLRQSLLPSPLQAPTSPPQILQVPLPPRLHPRPIPIPTAAALVAVLTFSKYPADQVLHLLPPPPQHHRARQALVPPLRLLRPRPLVVMTIAVSVVPLPKYKEMLRYLFVLCFGFPVVDSSNDHYKNPQIDEEDDDDDEEDCDDDEDDSDDTEDCDEDSSTATSSSSGTSSSSAPAVSVSVKAAAVQFNANVNTNANTAAKSSSSAPKMTSSAASSAQPASTGSSSGTKYSGIATFVSRYQPIMQTKANLPKVYTKQ